MALCEVALSDGSDLVAKEMQFGEGWNSPSDASPLFVILLIFFSKIMSNHSLIPSGSLPHGSVQKLDGRLNFL